MGIPVTRPCVNKQLQKGAAWLDIRLTLVGNSWQVGVIAWLVHQLALKLGLYVNPGQFKILWMLSLAAETVMPRSTSSAQTPWSCLN